MTDFDLALAHYRLTFPNLASLGAAPAYPTWRAEYDRVADGGLNAVLITSNAYEGASGSGQKNFAQTVLLEALLVLLAERDPEAGQKLLEPSTARPAINLGITVRLGC